MIFILYAFPLLFTFYSIPCESLKCYECTEYVPCGQGESALMVDCSGKCMVYRNQYDSGTVIRRCCTNDCGTDDGLRDYEGRVPTYFCSQDLCNGFGAEDMLTGGTVPTLTTTGVTTLSSIQTTTGVTTLSSIQTTTGVTTLSSIQTTTGVTTLSSTQTTTTVSVQSSVQCYDCSGSDCGKEGSNLAMNCPTCMVYRNPADQTIIERRCCSWGCGASFTVSIYNGIQTYFCSYDKCNRYGSETILSPPGTTIRSTSTSTTTTTTTSSTPSCTLNCQNGGTLETENGCFCYCAAKTNGLECENIDCVQPDDDDEGVCLPENQLLCDQSEIFSLKCLYICGKC